MATKWEAVEGRGKQDWRTSKDMEDIVTLINYGVLNQTSTKNKAVHEYLEESFAKLVNHKYAHEIILSHLSGVDKQNVDQLMEWINTYLHK